MGDRYLWDRAGEPDSEVDRLEELLGRYRSRRRLELPPERRGRVGRVLAATAAVLLAAAGVWLQRMAPSSSWKVERLAGSPSVAAKPLISKGWLRVGESLQTDASARARVEIGRIGRIEVGPDSRIRLVSSGWREQRIALERGRIAAVVWAPPRLFSVETASATAVDLGCEYTLGVGEDGAGALSVTRGWVELEWSGLGSIVPAGFTCALRRGRGPGLPRAAEAPSPLGAAVDRFDSGQSPESAVDEILSAARRGDGLTLWHMVARTEGAARERVYERLAALSPPPRGVTRAGALALDPRMLELWRFEMGTPSWPKSLSLWRAFWARATAR